MPKILNLTFLILITFFGNANLVIAQNDSLNSFLRNKKEELEPFDSSKVKIDLESLGLDNVDNNSKSNLKINSSNNISKNSINKTNSINANSNNNFNSSDPVISNNNNSSSIRSVNNESKITSFSDEEFKPIDQKTNIVKTSIIDDQAKANKITNSQLSIKKKSFSKINNAKKKKLALRLKQEEKKAKSKKNAKSKDENLSTTFEEDPKYQDESNFSYNKSDEENISLPEQANQKSQDNQNQDLAKYQKNKLKKLNYLRRLYLGEEHDENNQRLQQIDDDFVDNEKIIPKPKNLSRFAIHELPAFPILSSYRSDDNYHIPYILTPKENIKMLFDSIKDGDILRFIDIYKLIQNPNVQNNFGDTILTNAVISRKYTIIAEILARGADPDLPNQLGYSPIEIALEMLDFRALQMLVDNKANTGK
jgi:hypothetical protein